MKTQLFEKGKHQTSTLHTENKIVKWFVFLVVFCYQAVTETNTHTCKEGK